LIIISWLSWAWNGEPNKIFNTITWLSIILACQSHTWLSSRLNWKSRKIKEILPLALLVLLILIFFSIPSELLIENPLIIFPWLIYIWYYFYIVIKNK
jgi:ACR3 family arsenite efflux pump ArsB